MMAISLGRQLLAASSGLPERFRAGSAPVLAACAAARSLFDLASSGVYRAKLVTQPAGELLPHRFTLTEKSAVYFLLHFP